METCRICKGDQDSKQYKGYNICTECADLMEDLMSEYFQRTIKFGGSNSNRLYINYVETVQKFASDYLRIRKHSKQHIRHMEEHVNEEMKKGVEGGRRRYLERLLQTINWLSGSPEFYNYYFKDFSACKGCGASIFDHYDKLEVGNWFMIKCDKCDTVIKKYFSPKFMT
ncbi:MAG: hypothetical protein OIN86_02495 [Candidatus Methanoperedens sp.]|nr:hypothetical protein [Candidatus Methanoperedens sp.]CAG1003158.1 hypothetical protein METP1_03053 [Methanosarcinales archaeon]